MRLNKTFWKIGDRRIKKRFALFPCTLYKRAGEPLCKIWLQSYLSEYEKVDMLCFTHSSAYILKWMWKGDFLKPDNKINP